MATPKIRTQLHQVEARELEKRNESLPVEQRFRPAEEEIHLMISTSPSRYLERDATRWATHPDERVSVLFTRLAAGVGFSSRHTHVLFAGQKEVLTLARHASKEADEKELIWTPLLDTLTDAMGENREVRLLTDLEGRLKKVARWISREKDPEAFRSLTGLDSAAIRYNLLSEAQTLPADLIPHWIRSSQDAMMALRNSRLLRNHAPLLVLHILETVSGNELSHLAEDISEIPSEHFRKAPQGFADRIVDLCLERHEITALSVLLPKIRGISLDRMEKVLDFADYDSRLLSEAMVHVDAPKNLRPRLLKGEFGFPEALLTHPSTDAEILERAWREEHINVSAFVLHHPNTPPRLAVEVMQSSPGWWSLDEELPPVFTNSLVALSAVRSAPKKHPSVMLDLLDMLSRLPSLDAAHLAAFAEAAEALWESNPEEVLSALETITAAREMIAFPRPFFACMLSHPDSSVREKSLRLQGRLRPFGSLDQEEIKKAEKELDSIQKSVDALDLAEESSSRKLSKPGASRRHR